MQMNTQHTMTVTNRFEGTQKPLPCPLKTWVARVVACTLPKGLQRVL